ncbi:MAG: Carboxypeptidase regulatory-like domain [Thermoplasmata archaeon]|jgi:hypothetical protein|nr:Carboxypeptidase regulatory-like domain [Thermoplasmata archaeon]
MRVLPFAIVLVLFATAVVPAIPRAWAAGGERYAVSGVVLSDAGEPLAKAQVSAYVSADGYGANDQTVTDETGAYTLSLPAGQGNVNVYYAPWRASAGRDVTVSANLTGVDFKLVTPPPKTAIVEGRVLGPDGAPVEGATVSLGYACCIAYATATPAPTTAESDSASSGTTSAMPIRAPGPYYGDFPDPVTTGADGAYRFATYGGSYQMTAWAKGFAQTTQTVEAKDNETVKQDVKLERVPAADAIVEGKVVDARTGLPVANAQVYVSNLAWSRSNFTTTDEKGAFRVATLPGWSQITISAEANRLVPEPMATDDKIVARPLPAPGGEAGPAYYQYQHALSLVPGSNPVDVKLAPKPAPSVALVGYVVDHDAKTGVASAWVNVWNQDAGEWGNAQTDATGSYKILVRPGHYTINAYADGYLGGAESFVLGADPSQARQDVQVVKGAPRYAPCDEGCGGPIMYEKGIAASSAPDAAPATAPTAASPSPASARDAASAAPTAGGASGASSSGAQAYSGTGGGLPPYSESAAGTPTPTGEAGATKPAPGPALALLVGAVALAALAARRRR